MGTKMATPPIFFALIQVRFNTLMALENYANAIQETFRKQGFPDVQREVVATINLPIPSGNGGPPQLTQTPRYLFANMNRTAGFILEPSAISFQTNEYDVFETFSESFMAGLSAVHAAVDLNYSDRIGARYLDAIYPRDGESLNDYLTPSALGLTTKSNGGDLQYAFSESLFRKGQLSVLARTIIQGGSVTIPADLAQTFLSVPERFAVKDGLHAILDTDSFLDHREPFSLDRVRVHLIDLHNEITAAFLATVTPKALEIWSEK
jgi:uncharacterized protein (TIGR04255 family)